MPSDPVQPWTYPSDGSKMCSQSAEGGAGSPVKEWCGTGWTGQPNVVAMRDGTMMVREGAYDGHYHFLDAGTGEPVMPDLVTDDLAKGSATSDPDGYPLYYAGSRDNRFRVVAMDRAEPTVLFEIDAHDTTLAPQPLWNDDWDGAALVIGDILLEGGENGWLYVVRLNRGYDAQGLVTVDPEVVATVPGFDDAAARPTPATRMSRSSPRSRYRDGVVYVANSGGLITGWDISDVQDGGSGVHQVFRYWTGDDTDASIVIDDEGYLYVASEYQRFDERSQTTGPADEARPPPARRPAGLVRAGARARVRGRGRQLVDAGARRGGALRRRRPRAACSRSTARPARSCGSVRSARPRSARRWWWTARCCRATARGTSTRGTSRTRTPSRRSSGTSTSETASSRRPAVWHGWLYVGTREGYLYGIADADTPPPTATLGS